MTMEEKLQRQININLQLRKQLETARKDTVEYCAKFCEDHEVCSHHGERVIRPADLGRTYTHSGDGYAKALRGIIGE